MMRIHSIRLHFRRPQNDVVTQLMENHERFPECGLRRGMSDWVLLVSGKYFSLLQ